MPGEETVAAAAIIIAAAITAGTTITAAVMNSNDTEDAQNEARKLANISRGDDLSYKANQEKMTKMQLGLQKKQFAWQQTESVKDRAERSGVRAYEQKENSFNSLLNLVNTQSTLRNNFYSLSQRGQQNVVGGKV